MTASLVYHLEPTFEVREQNGITITYSSATKPSSQKRTAYRSTMIARDEPKPNNP